MKNETTNTSNATIVAISNLETLMSTHTKLSLKRICDETKVCYQYALKASKQPIIGKPYDPTTFNNDAVQKIFDRKGVNFEEYDWVAIEESVKKYEPLNKIEDFKVGDEFTMRSAKSTCRIVLLNEDFDNTVIEVVFKDYDNGKMRVMNVDTFLHQSPRIIK